MSFSARSAALAPAAACRYQCQDANTQQAVQISVLQVTVMLCKGMY
jgi:hypothetical protein